jgi:type VI secretion system protein ImpA
MLDEPQQSDLQAASVASPPEPPAAEPSPGEPLPADSAPPAEAAGQAPPASPFALASVSPDDPCGPDLDFDGDAEFLNFFAATEGILPRNLDEYYKFDRVAAGMPARIETAAKLLGRTLDVRLLLLLAKLSILDRDVAGFARWVGSVDWLLRERWDGAHPRAEAGDHSIRLAQLMALEDNAAILLPLQYAILLELPREGSFSYRDQLGATGAVKPRSVMAYGQGGERETTVEEKLVPQKTIEKILRDVEIEKLAGLAATLRGLGDALKSIRNSSIEHVGFEKSIELPKLDKLVSDMAEFARGALVSRDPTAGAAAETPAAAGEAEAAAPVAAPSAFATRADVDAALAGALGYFSVSEPTSPALLLIRQAREMLGKNLYEVMQLMAAPHADNARLSVGPEGAFTVPVKILAAAPSAEFERAEPPPVPTRAAALALIDAVTQHMQRAEPSSPVPYLLERAKGLATRDFVSLLHDVLSDEAIAALKKGK